MSCAAVVLEGSEIRTKCPAERESNSSAHEGSRWRARTNNRECGAQFKDSTATDPSALVPLQTKKHARKEC